MPRTYMCPYFMNAKGLKVTCDAVSFDFTGKKALEVYVGSFCGNISGWERCPIADEITKKYERTEKNENTQRR